MNKNKNAMISKKDYKRMIGEHLPAIFKFYILMVNKNGDGVWKGEYKNRMNEHIAVLRDCELAKDSKTKLIERHCEENGFATVDGIMSALSDTFAANNIVGENAVALSQSLINNMPTIVGKIDTSVVKQ